MRRYLVVETRTDLANLATPGRPLRRVHGFRTIDAALVLMAAAATSLAEEGLELVPSPSQGFEIWRADGLELVGSLEIEAQGLAVLCAACGEVHDGGCLEAIG